MKCPGNFLEVSDIFTSLLTMSGVNQADGVGGGVGMGGGAALAIVAHRAGCSS